MYCDFMNLMTLFLAEQRTKKAHKKDGNLGIPQYYKVEIITIFWNLTV